MVPRLRIRHACPTVFALAVQNPRRCLTCEINLRYLVHRKSETSTPAPCCCQSREQNSSKLAFYVARGKVSAMGTMGEELQTLRTRAEEATRLESELQEATENTARLQGLYQVEQASAFM